MIVRHLLALMVATLLPAGCTCGCKSSSSAAADVRPDGSADASGDGLAKLFDGLADGRGDHPADQGARDRPPDRKLRPDYGPISDLNLATCTPADASAPIDRATAGDAGAFGALAWQRELLPGPKAEPTVALTARGNAVYFSMSHYGLIALDGPTGTLRWRHPTPTEGSSLFSSIHALADGLVYSQEIEGFVGKRSYADGSLLWRIQMPGPFDASLIYYGRVTPPVALLGDGSLLAAGTNMAMKRFAADGKSILWSAALHGASLRNNIITDGTRIYVGLHLSSRIAAYTLAGKLLWEQKAPGSSVNVVLGAANSLVAISAIPNQQGTLSISTVVAAYDRACGKRRWTLPLDAVTTTATGTRVGPQGRIVIATRKWKSFIRLNGITRDGQKTWTHTLDNLRQPGTPASNLESIGPIGADGQLYTLRCKPVAAASHETLMQAFDVESGAETASIVLPVPGCPARSAAVLLDSGMLVTTMYDGIKKPTYAIGIRTRSPGLARSAWPTQYGNNERTTNTGP